MFDRAVIIAPGRTETQYVTREVHEHRAPTDESIKILRDMEAKAWARVEDVLLSRADGNEVAAVRYMWMAERPSCVFAFTINGRPYRVETDDHLTPEKMRDAIAKGPRMVGAGRGAALVEGRATNARQPAHLRLHRCGDLAAVRASR